MTNNENKEYKIYLRREKQFIPVSKEVYYGYYRPIWAQRKKAQDHGQCTCPHHKLWMCDGDCCTCPYHSTGDSLSLDFEYACGDNKTTLADSIEDPVNLEVNVMRQILLESILTDFKQLDAEGARIYELLGEELSDCKIAEALGRTQSTFNYQIRKMRTELKSVILTSSNIHSPSVIMVAEGLLNYFYFFSFKTVAHLQLQVKAVIKSL